HSQKTIGQHSTVKTLFEGPEKCRCCINWVEELPYDLPLAIEQQEESKQHALLIRMKKSHDNDRNPLVLDSIVVQSPYLKGFLGELFQSYEGIKTNLQKLVFKSPFKPFFYEWQKLNDLVLLEQDPVRIAHARLLKKTLKSELKDTISVSQDYERNGVTSFEMLWTIFKPGIDVYTREDEYDRIYQLVDSSYHSAMRIRYFELDMRCINHGQKTFGYQSKKMTIWDFEGIKTVTSLDVFPAHYHPSIERLRLVLKKRGERFRDLQTIRNCHREYNGLAQLDKGNKRKVDGRIMIDSEAYLSFNPNKPIHLQQLDGAELKSWLDVSDQIHEPMMPLPRQDGRHIHDDLLYLCSPQVRGYCFKIKEWASFYVDKITDIKWNDHAFGSLILPSDYKRLILLFVESQIHNKNQFDDVIEGKGKKMQEERRIIMLLEGSPGVGKTLTAEALADRIRKPLYAISVAELGSTAKDLERRLTMILEVAVKWDAVVLLDESDVFLEKRRADSLTRNSIVAIFLRLLEYYRGVLFLTTNRVHSMDPAFQSRIHLRIQYPDLEEPARRQIWKQFTELSNRESVLEPQHFEELGRWDLNGREIKNLVKTAQLLASHEAAPLGMGHIQTVLRVTQKSFGGTSE
ncbi:uncharacterized protein K452DRAFT_224609, partial [Aplosporella prunicola CBS 121167]